MSYILRVFSFVLAILMLLPACSDEIIINAPYKDIWVVYGVLSLGDTAQYIRISKAYQVEGDAYQYAKDNDLSVKGLKVMMKQGNKIWYAKQLDSIPKENGIFYPYTTIYRFKTTKGDSALIPNRKYELIIQDPKDSTLKLTAHTTIPHPPNVISYTVNNMGNDYCLDYLLLEDTLSVNFVGREFSQMLPGNGYQLKFILDYQENSQPKRYEWLYGSIVKPQGINAIGNFTIAPNTIPNSFATLVADTSKTYYFQSQPDCASSISQLTHAASLQVMAMDTFLWTNTYIYTPNYLTFSTVKPIFTNISGTKESLGMFGSLSYTQYPVALTQCGMYKMNLNKTVRPFDCQ